MLRLLQMHRIYYVRRHPAPRKGGFIIGAFGGYAFMGGTWRSQRSRATFGAGPNSILDSDQFPLCERRYGGSLLSSKGLGTIGSSACSRFTFSFTFSSIAVAKRSAGCPAWAAITAGLMDSISSGK